MEQLLPEQFAPSAARTLPARPALSALEELISSVAELRGTAVISVGGQRAPRSQAKQSGEASPVVPADGRHARTPLVPRARQGWEEAGPKPLPEGGRRPVEGEALLGALPPVSYIFG